MISRQTCPVCEHDLKNDASASQFFPFCSERCQQIDLFRWSEGCYAIVEKIDGESDSETNWKEE